MPSLATAHRALRPSLLTLSHTRPISWLSFGKNKKDDPPTPTPTISDLLRQSPKTKTTATPGTFSSPRGSLSSSSIFGDESSDTPPPTTTPITSTPLSHVQILDPNRQSWAWPKRADARDHRRRGRLTDREKWLQTEKEHVAKSHMFKTSVKKLAPIARQIHGKRIEDAIVQMRFSEKKAAKDVLGHLYHARNEAVVRKGMDPEKTFVEQAWVGRGTYGREHSHRARGRIDLLRLPYTSITVVLKEEATRKRVEMEREAKKLRKNPWEHLPSRPLYGQQQYYKW